MDYRENRRVAVSHGHQTEERRRKGRLRNMEEKCGEKTISIRLGILARCKNCGKTKGHRKVEYLALISRQGDENDEDNLFQITERIRPSFIIATECTAA